MNNQLRQVNLERATVDAMYRRLDQQLAEARDAHRRALAAPVESPQERYARDVEVGRLDARIAERQAAGHALCFGRIDPSVGAARHIGRIGLRDEAGEIILVDWRADAARPFYAATAADPQGLRRRRHLRLQGRVVAGVSDELLDGSAPTDADVIGDGPLADALGAARTGRMREAVSTLQSQQDAIVRSAHRGITVVQGGPGTGKTVVALHRAAYVLYAFPRAAADGVLVYGPNQRFLDYISEVLPSLGENDVVLATAADLLGITARREEPAAVAERKGRADLAAALAAAARRHQPRGVPFTVAVGNDTLTLGAAVIDAARKAALQDAPAHNAARAAFAEYVVEELVEELEQRAAATMDALDAEVASVLGIDLDRAVGADLRRLGLDDEPVSGGQPEFDAETVRASLADDPDLDAAIERIWPHLDPSMLLEEVLTDPTALRELWPDASAPEIARLAERPRAELSTADLPLLDEARELVVGAPDKTFGHVVIDEAQELTEMQWRMLMRRCPARSMTIVGDLAQAGSATPIPSWETALCPFVARGIDVHTLTVNYRTTAEILAASAPLLAEIAPGQQLSSSIRHGDAPRTVDAADADPIDLVGTLVARERDAHPDALIGVVCAPGQVEALVGEVEKSATVVAATEVRGLEFDTVILVDPAAIRAHRAAGVRDLYVATTRATRRLIIIDR